jgi:uncharacterized membrane protein
MRPGTRRMESRTGALHAGSTRTGSVLSPNGQTKANIRRITDLEMEALHRRSVADRVWDTLGSIAGGSWFAAFHVIWFAAWIAVNRGYVRGIKPFDPYPFNLLTMIVSLEAIFVPIAVLNSQNHMTRLADRRTHLDLQINMLAEAESTATLRLLRQIAEHLKLPVENVCAVASAPAAFLVRVWAIMSGRRGSTDGASAAGGC